MTLSGKPIADHELQAYIDNELALQRRAEVEQFLGKNPVTNNELKEYKLFNQAFHQMYDEVLEENIPRRLLSFDKRKERTMPLAHVASLLIAITVGIVMGWVARDEGILGELGQSTTQAMVKDAFAYHAVYTPEVRHPVEVPREQQKHLLKWLSKRLQTPLKAPRLARHGFELLGGRLLTTDSQPAAQFMYENASGQRVTLFTRQRNQSESISAFRYASRGRVNGFYWTDGDLSFVLIADIPKPQVSELAHIVYEDLNQ